MDKTKEIKYIGHTENGDYKFLIDGKEETISESMAFMLSRSGENAREYIKEVAKYALSAFISQYGFSLDQESAAKYAIDYAEELWRALEERFNGNAA